MPLILRTGLFLLLGLQIPAPASQSLQPPGGPPVPWATVAIHPSDPNSPGNYFNNDQPNGINERGAPLINIISEGYNMSVMPLRPENVLGLPDWARSARYDIQARVDPDDIAAFKKLSNLSMADTITAFSTHHPTGEMLMMQNLLTDRFHLRVHWETRDRGVYTINLAKGGLRMKPAADPLHGEMTFNRGHLAGKGVPLTFLASLLEIPTERPVIDKTNLPGSFDFDLKFDPHDSTDNNETNDPDLFTAVQEQLGLKLESTHAPVPVLVIDHVDPPTPN